MSASRKQDTGLRLAWNIGVQYGESQKKTRVLVHQTVEDSTLADLPALARLLEFHESPFKAPKAPELFPDILEMCVRNMADSLARLL